MTRRRRARASGAASELRKALISLPLELVHGGADLTKFAMAIGIGCNRALGQSRLAGILALDPVLRASPLRGINIEVAELDVREPVGNLCKGIPTLLECVPDDTHFGQVYRFRAAASEQEEEREGGKRFHW